MVPCNSLDYYYKCHEAHKLHDPAYSNGNFLLHMHLLTKGHYRVHLVSKLVTTFKIKGTAHGQSLLS